MMEMNRQTEHSVLHERPLIVTVAAVSKIEKYVHLNKGQRQ